jgi:hypothetical protein
MREYAWFLVVLAAPMILGAVIAVRQWLIARSIKQNEKHATARGKTERNHSDG